MIDTRFSRSIFEVLPDDDKRSRCDGLAAELSKRLRTAETFSGAIDASIAELRALGHELWSWDEDDRWEIWGPDYQAESLHGLIIRFDQPDSVEIFWRENADPSTLRQMFGEGLR